MPSRCSPLFGLVCLLMATLACAPGDAPIEETATATLEPTNMITRMRATIPGSPTETPRPSFAPDATATIASPTATETQATPSSPTPFVRGPWRITGQPVPELASFDQTMADYMQARGISAGALAVTYQGRLVMAHGYTWDADESYAIQPNSRFRIASLSKPITAVAVLTLVEAGNINLDSSLGALCGGGLLASEPADLRWSSITVRHLLTHTAGWDIAQLGYDPMFNDQNIAATLNTPLPIGQNDIVTFMLAEPLSSEPGASYAYSNFGYLLLGQIIACISGESYERYVHRAVLAPLGMSDTALGASLPAEQLAGEVRYESEFRGTTVFDASGDLVPWPYGGWNIGNMAAHGGWVSTVADMARFAASFDSPANHPLLSADTIALMFAPPSAGAGFSYYSMGWAVIEVGLEERNIWHTGSIDGILTIMVRRYDGINWVAFFNRRESAADPTGSTFWDIDGLLHLAADAVDTWPDHDLFTP